MFTGIFVVYISNFFDQFIQIEYDLIPFNTLSNESSRESEGSNSLAELQFLRRNLPEPANWCKMVGISKQLLNGRFVLIAIPKKRPYSSSSKKLIGCFLNLNFLFSIIPLNAEMLDYLFGVNCKPILDGVFLTISRIPFISRML